MAAARDLQVTWTLCICYVSRFCCNLKLSSICEMISKPQRCVSECSLSPLRFTTVRKAFPGVRNLVRAFTKPFSKQPPSVRQCLGHRFRAALLLWAGPGSPRPPQAPFVGEELPSSARNLWGPRGARRYLCGSTCARTVPTFERGNRASGEQQRPEPASAGRGPRTSPT